LCGRDAGLVPARPRHYRGETKLARQSLPLPSLPRPVQQHVKKQRLKVEEIVYAPPKPPPIGKPLVWADTRQELCEGVPYFRAYQSGIYFRSDLARGYLLDAFGAERDFIGSHVVISHGYSHLAKRSDDVRGGRSSIDPSTNVRSLAGSQLNTDRGVSALLSNWRTETPIVLIVGNRCSASPVPRPSSHHLISRVPFRTDIVSWTGSEYRMLGSPTTGSKFDGSVNPTPLPPFVGGSSDLKSWERTLDGGLPSLSPLLPLGIFLCKNVRSVKDRRLQSTLKGGCA
jgi:hypothetical protein